MVNAQQPNVHLGWTPNSEPYLNHYRLYRDTISGTMVYYDIIDKSDSTYSDSNVEFGKKYYYKLTAVDSLGNESEASTEVIAVIILNDLEKKNDIIFPIVFELKKNYPNPFNSTTKILYSIPKACQVRIIIFDVLGRVVKRLVDNYQAAGKYKVIWDGRDEVGKYVSSGIYFYQMIAGSFQTTNRIFYSK